MTGRFQAALGLFIIAAFALAIGSCRAEQPTERPSDEESASAAKGRMLDLCKGGFDDACERLGLRRAARPPAQPQAATAEEHEPRQQAASQSDGADRSKPERGFARRLRTTI